MFLHERANFWQFHSFAQYDQVIYISKAAYISPFKLVLVSKSFSKMFPDRARLKDDPCGTPTPPEGKDENTPLALPYSDFDLEPSSKEFCNLLIVCLLSDKVHNRLVRNCREERTDIRLKESHVPLSQSTRDSLSAFGTPPSGLPPRLYGHWSIFKSVQALV